MAEEKSRQSGVWPLIGSVGAALGAAVCCLGPVVFVSLGVGGAWIGQLSALEAYRPLFMAVAAGFLGFGFYRVYGSAGTSSSREGDQCAEACEVPRAARINRAALWGATLVVAGLFASPYLLALGGASGPEGGAAAEATADAPRGGDPAGPGAAAEASRKQVELKVEGMTCQGCVKTLSTALEDVDGVERADVTLEPPRARVTYDPDRVSSSEIETATDEVGFPSEVVD